MSAITLITTVHVRPPTRPQGLRLSPLLRYALASASTRRDGKPLLLPTSIPQKCCHGLWRCRDVVHWRVGDGQNWVFFCLTHFEDFWDAGHDVQDFDICRWCP